jgi:hypothetical protein
MRHRAHDAVRMLRKNVGRGDVENGRWGDGMIKTETNPYTSAASVYFLLKPLQPLLTLQTSYLYVFVIAVGITMTKSARPLFSSFILEMSSCITVVIVTVLISWLYLFRYHKIPW